ncbi:hypothetical protein [Staphylococcus americanisciuri]|uniref:Uncharacterized protein n=1 Tax=Staphylococcus americanisciuri TaxID=2973940 RepID=A0ABT2EZT7_9STAP|nr:hypothetical protein [Staphylococcus americanisciuri]MCS4485718.1 hypothetical protein [Staphylococcus americanisciuri]
MGRKILAVLLGIVAFVTAWSMIKMFIALAHSGGELKVSYAPLPLQLANPNMTVLIISIIIYAAATIMLAFFTIKLIKPKQ